MRTVQCLGPQRGVRVSGCAQLAVGCLLSVAATFGGVARSKARFGATTPAAGVSEPRAFVVQALITFLLVFVIMSMATDARVPAALAAPSIGFGLVAAVLIGGGITCGAVNPDRALRRAGRF